MSNIKDSLYNIRLLDDFAYKESAIHSLHPLSKLVTTVVFLAVVLSFGRYETGALLPFFFYPVVIIAVAEIPIGPIVKRILLVSPFILGIGILNPVFDQQMIQVLHVEVSRGWLTFLAIVMKGSLTVSVSLLLIATTGMEKLAAALRMLKVPRIFVLQLLLTYRYISVLIEEVLRMMRAYSLRAPRQKGIHPSVWGSFLGQLILRTFDRAQRVYQSMSLRGFTGEYPMGRLPKIGSKDVVYLLGWSFFFMIAKFYNLSEGIGSLIVKVVN